MVEPGFKSRHYMSKVQAHIHCTTSLSVGFISKLRKFFILSPMFFVFEVIVLIVTLRVTVAAQIRAITWTMFVLTLKKRFLKRVLPLESKSESRSVLSDSL